MTKRITWWLLSLALLLLAACGSGGAAIVDQSEVAAPGDDPAAAEPTVASDDGTVEDTADVVAGSPADDPLFARERDWKLGALNDPAVTIIEYGDFQ